MTLMSKLHLHVQYTINPLEFLTSQQVGKFKLQIIIYLYYLWECKYEHYKAVRMD